MTKLEEFEERAEEQPQNRKTSRQGCEYRRDRRSCNGAESKFVAPRNLKHENGETNQQKEN